MKKFFKEFKEFALRGNVMDMAVGIIIGGAFSGIVTSLTDNFINPIINLIMGNASYTKADVIGFGSAFLASVVNFVIMAFILFCLIRGINKLMSVGKKKEEPKAPTTNGFHDKLNHKEETPAAPTTKICPYCKSEIPLDAVRCAHCTSELPE